MHAPSSATLCISRVLTFRNWFNDLTCQTLQPRFLHTQFVNIVFVCRNHVCLVVLLLEMKLIVIEHTVSLYWLSSFNGNAFHDFIFQSFDVINHRIWQFYLLHHKLNKFPVNWRNPLCSEWLTFNYLHVIMLGITTGCECY